MDDDDKLYGLVVQSRFYRRERRKSKLALKKKRHINVQLQVHAREREQLLYQLVPKPIAEQLLDYDGLPSINIFRTIDSVSILFASIVDYNNMWFRLKHDEVVFIVNALFVAYDRLCKKHFVFKVKTVQGTYMAMTGGVPSSSHHAKNITNFALALRKVTGAIRVPSTKETLGIRIGIHSGSVAAGIFSNSNLRYDVFGDTVNIAARMQSAGESMRIHVSEDTAKLLKQEFLVKCRGTIPVKGKGHMTTYWVLGRAPRYKNSSAANWFTRVSKPRERMTVEIIKRGVYEELHGSTKQTLQLAHKKEEILTAELLKRIMRTDELLDQVILKPIVNRPHHASILFTDIVGYTEMCSHLQPMDVVYLLQSLFLKYDELSRKYNVFKVQTIGDAYMAMETSDHVEDITNFAFDIANVTEQIVNPTTQESLTVRIGIDSGLVEARLVGISNQRYEVFGATVIIANMLEFKGEPKRVHVSANTAQLLHGRKGFRLIERYKVDVEEQHFMSTYWVEKEEEKLSNLVAVLQPELLPEVLPELLPEVLPELLPELLPDGLFPASLVLGETMNWMS